MPTLEDEIEARDAYIQELKKALSDLQWPNVPSADDLRLLAVMAAGSHANTLLPLIERLETAQQNAAKLLMLL